MAAGTVIDRQKLYKNPTKLIRKKNIHLFSLFLYLFLGDPLFFIYKNMAIISVSSNQNLNSGCSFCGVAGHIAWNCPKRHRPR
ncbi:hypothetical protein BDF21DRAFT_431101 [Thamnidium elegans]|nr:hypothetical protein BDF21DRAFT_431101 [Thamnidium elegans]